MGIHALFLLLLWHTTPVWIRRLLTTPVIISYSGGASSEWMIEAVIQGLIPRPPRLAVMFADTGSEHQWTYDRVNEVELRCAKAGIYFLRVSAMDHKPRAGWLRRAADCMARWHSMPDELGPDRIRYREKIADTLMAASAIGLPALPIVSVDPSRTPIHEVLIDMPHYPDRFRIEQPPLFVDRNGTRGQAPSRCTRHYKVTPLARAASAWCKGNSWPRDVIKWIGFSKDEAHRAPKAVARARDWESMDFPAIRLGRTRADQRRELTKWVGDCPPWSACITCPWNDPRRWRDTPKNEQDIAIAADEGVRDASSVGITDGPAYLSDRLIPLRELIERGDPQPALPGLEAYCASGSCFL